MITRQLENSPGLVSMGSMKEAKYENFSKSTRAKNGFSRTVPRNEIFSHSIGGASSQNNYSGQADDDDLNSSGSGASSSTGVNGLSTSEVTKLREFRKMVTLRSEPSTVIFLRRLVLVMTALMFAILSVETALKANFYKTYKQLSTLKDSIEEITVDLMHVHSGFRTLINIHNDIYPDSITGLVA